MKILLLFVLTMSTQYNLGRINDRQLKKRRTFSKTKTSVANLTTTRKKPLLTAYHKTSVIKYFLEVLKAEKGTIKQQKKASFVNLLKPFEKYGISLNKDIS